MEAVCGLLLAALAALAPASQAQDPITALYLADIEDCSAYYEYVPHKRYCPLGLRFNSEIRACDWAINVDDDCNTIPRNHHDDEKRNETCPALGTCPSGPQDRDILLPHRKECNLYCRCDHGVPKLEECPPNLHFNRKESKCEPASSAGCDYKECHPLKEVEHGHWDSAVCMDEEIGLGTTCGMVCEAGYDVSITRNITCTDEGWTGFDERIDITCMSKEDRAEALMDMLNSTLENVTEVYFVADMSEYVTEEAFADGILPFMNTIYDIVFEEVLPEEDILSTVILYSDTASVALPLGKYSPNEFEQKVQGIKYVPGGKGDVSVPLKLVNDQIEKSPSTGEALVVVISGSENTDDGLPEAEDIKDKGGNILGIVIDSPNNELINYASVDEGGDLMYIEFNSWETFNTVNDYIVENSTTTGPNDKPEECYPLEEVEHGHWDSVECMEKDIGLGTTCGMICDAGYDVSISRNITCTKDGWTGIDERIDITCLSSEERAEALVDQLKEALVNVTEVFFVADSSELVSETNFEDGIMNFVPNIYYIIDEEIPKEEDVLVSVILYSDRASVVIPLDKYSPDEFEKKVKAIPYYPGGHSDVATGLELVNELMEQSPSTGEALIVVISASENSNEGLPEAEQIKKKGGDIMAVVIDSPDNELMNYASVDDHGDLMYIEFNTWDTFDIVDEYIADNTYSGKPTDDSKECYPLEEVEHGHWDSAECMDKDIVVGTSCGMVCEAGYDVSISRNITCTEDGWTGIDERIDITCLSTEERGKILMDQLKEALVNVTEVFFVADSSELVSEPNFVDGIQNFVPNIYYMINEEIPKEEDVLVSVILYSDRADVVIPLDKYSPEEFEKKVKAIPYYPGGHSDVVTGLELVNELMEQSPSTGEALIVVISASENSNDGLPEAEQIKKNGGDIMAVVIDSPDNELMNYASVDDHGDLMYIEFNTWDTFNTVDEYIVDSTPSGKLKDGAEECYPLEEVEHGHWDSVECMEKDIGLGTTCGMICDAGYDVSVSRNITCTEDGWTGIDERIDITCLSTAERGEILMDQLKEALVNVTEVFFVADSSELVSETNFVDGILNFIINIYYIINQEIPKEEDVLVSVILYSDTARVVIPLGKYSPEELEKEVMAIPYYPGGYSDVVTGLELVNEQMEQSPSTGEALIVVISASENSNEGLPEAEQIKKNGGDIMALVIDSPDNDLMNYASVDDHGDLMYIEFNTWDTFNTVDEYIVDNAASDKPNDDFEECYPLAEVEHGHWDSSECMEKDIGLGTTCGMVCDAGYDVSISRNITCTEDGWTGIDERIDITCLSIEERGDDLMQKLTYALENVSELYFVADMSQSVPEEEFVDGILNFMITIYHILYDDYLHEGDLAAVILYSDDANVVIPLDSYTPEEFEQMAAEIIYSPGGKSDVATGLKLVNEQMEKSSSNGNALVVVITANENTDDGLPEAEDIKEKGGDLMVIAIDAPNNELMNYASVEDNGELMYIEFNTWDNFNLAVEYVVEADSPNEDETCPAVGTCPTGQQDQDVLLPHRDDCSLYCRCENGDPKLEGCPYGLHFSAKRSRCEPPSSAGCENQECHPLEEVEHGHWSSADCMDEEIGLGTSCSLVCDAGYDVSISRNLTCTDSGWLGIDERIDITCLNIEERGDVLMDKLNYTLGNVKEVFFVADMSEAVPRTEFDDGILQFIINIYYILYDFIYDDDFLATVILYSDDANVAIPLGSYSPEEFEQMVNRIKYSPGGPSNIANALQLVDDQIQMSPSSGEVLTFVISASENSNDGLSKAEEIKEKGGIIFPLVIESPNNELINYASEDDRGDLMYIEFSSPEEFISMSDYVIESYGQIDDLERNITCEGLSDTNRQYWEDPACIEPSVPNGTLCHLYCYEGYEVIGSSEMTCTARGWEAYPGATEQPNCYTIAETGDRMVDEIKQTHAGLFFLLDMSGSVTLRNFEKMLNFVRATIKVFSLSESLTAGMLTFDDTSNMIIPLNESNTCNFITKMDEIYYRGGTTDIGKALTMAKNEMDKYGSDIHRVLILITDGISNTDPYGLAEEIKAQGNTIITIGVSGFEASQLAPLSSLDGDGKPYFYGMKDFYILESIAEYLYSQSSDDLFANCTSA